LIRPPPSRSVRHAPDTDLASPRQLGARIRWLFLVFIMFNVVTAVPRILDSGTVALPRRATGVLAALALAYWWLRGCTGPGSTPSR